jgi:uncharacterized protein (TIGR02391 family)
MRIEDLAVAILFELGSAPENMVNRVNFINYVVDDEQYGWRKGGRIVHGSVYVPGAGQQQRQALKTMLGRAWDLLLREDYLAPDPSQGHNSKFCVVTERGRDLLSRPRPQALDWARAVAALNHPLHERLQNAGVDAMFRSGQLDTAIRDAFRDVEHVVREMSQLQHLKSPVPLMEQAFMANTGPLADRQAPTPEQHARQRLFMGAFGRYRNAPNHTYVSYDPGEAVEIVLLASLLLRELDEVGRRVGTMPIDAP